MREKTFEYSKEHVHERIKGRLRDVHKQYQEGQSIQNIHTPKALIDDILEKLAIFRRSVDHKDVLVIANYDVLKYLCWLNSEGLANYNSLTFLTDIDPNTLPNKDKVMYSTIVANLSSPDTIDMMGKKFDIVLGNPPYQSSTGSSAGTPIWHKFVDIALNSCIDNGCVVLIHPAGWRNGKTKFKKISNRLKNLQMVFCQLSDYSTGVDHFGVNTTCDWYLLHNRPNTDPTRIIDCDGNVIDIDLKNVAQLPNSVPPQYTDCIDLTLTNTVNVGGDTTYHTQKDFMQKTQDDVYKYPVMYTLKQSGPSFWYTKDNTRGHYGTPKILMGRGLGMPVLDLEGNIAPCEFSYYITAENNEVLQEMYNALCNPECIKLCKILGSGKGHNYLKEAVSLLHKDFWKHFNA